jgi:ferritin-like metal-binding protein YciE
MYNYGRKGESMSNKTIKSLFLDGLKDIYDAENQLVKAIPKMADHARSEELKKAFNDHLKQTKNHVKRVEEIFDKIDVKKESKSCAGMRGIVHEGEEMMKSFSESQACDAALIAAAQKIEHYEIASYGTLRTYAEQLDFDGVADQLQETLDEEGEANALLTELAINDINDQARK